MSVPNANSNCHFLPEKYGENMLLSIFAFINQINSRFDFSLKKILVIFVHG